MKYLPWINFAGVVLLVVLCATQWTRDRSLNLEINRWQKVSIGQQEKIKEQEKNLRSQADDLDHFKSQFKEAHADAAAAHDALRKSDHENVLLKEERDQLKVSITNWARAVEARDERLRDLDGKLRDVAARLQESVQKYNDLATNYNSSVTRFNELATNYNSVVKQLNESRK